MVIRELINMVGFQVNDAQLRAAEHKMKAVAQNVTAAGRKMALFVTLPILAIGGAMIKSASDAEETRTKFETVFKDVSIDAEKIADHISKNFGLAGSTTRKLLSDTGDLLTGFGFTGDAALDLSKQVNELAVDLASFTNFEGGAEGASKALTKALLGERESVKSLGISILEEDVKLKVLDLTRKGMRFETTRQAKAYAALAIAQEQSKNAIGDYNRTGTGFANTFRRMRERIKALSESFGMLLLPTALNVVNKLILIIEKFTDLSESNKKIIIGIAGFVAAIAPLLLIFGSIAGAVLKLHGVYVMIAVAMAKGGFLYSAFATIGTFIAGITAPVWALIAALIVLVGAIYLVWNDLYTWVTGGESLIENFLGTWENFSRRMGVFFAVLKEDLKQFMILFKRFIIAIIPDKVFEAWNKFGQLIERIFAKIKAGYDATIGKLPAFIFNKISQGKEFIKDQGRQFIKGGGILTPGFEQGSFTVNGGSLAAGGGQSVGSSVNVSSNTVINVPSDMSNDQKVDLENRIRKVNAEENRKMINNVLINNPEVE